MTVRRALGRMAAATLTSLVIALSMTAGCGGDDETDGTCAASATASLAFGVACCADAECSTGKCGDFMQKGKRCTQDCPGGDSDCLMTDGSNLGCGGQGICKVP